MQTKQIEVESKFEYDANDTRLQRLISESSPLETVKYDDTYFDTPTYELTKRDIWFRLRNNNLELKVPLQNSIAHDCYEEITNWEGIRNYLNNLLNEKCFENVAQDVKQFLKQFYNMDPFAKILSKRKSYMHDKFRIDLDETDFGFNIGEIELMVDNENKIEEAKSQIDTLAERFGIQVSGHHTRGKLGEYISRFNSEQYVVLTEAGLYHKK